MPLPPNVESLCPPPPTPVSKLLRGLCGSCSHSCPIHYIISLFAISYVSLLSLFAFLSKLLNLNEQEKPPLEAKEATDDVIDTKLKRKTKEKKQPVKLFPTQAPPPWTPKPEMNVVSVQPQDQERDDGEFPASSSSDEENEVTFLALGSDWHFVPCGHAVFCDNGVLCVTTFNALKRSDHSLQNDRLVSPTSVLKWLPVWFGELRN